MFFGVHIVTPSIGLPAGLAQVCMRSGMGQGAGPGFGPAQTRLSSGISSILVAIQRTPGPDAPRPAGPKTHRWSGRMGALHLPEPGHGHWGL